LKDSYRLLNEARACSRPDRAGVRLKNLRSKGSMETSWRKALALRLRALQGYCAMPAALQRTAQGLRQGARAVMPGADRRKRPAPGR
jgi:hypothetical protein